MNVSRRIERDRVAHRYRAFECRFNCADSVLVRHEVEGSKRRFYGLAVLAIPYDSRVEWDYLHLDQFASRSGEVLRQGLVILWEKYE